MRFLRISIMMGIFLAYGATAVVAGGVMTLLESALVLEGQYDDLEAEINSCSGGTCPGANDLVDELAALGQELASLQGGIAACGCTNATLDAVVQDIETMDSDLQAIVDSW